MLLNPKPITPDVHKVWAHCHYFNNYFDVCIEVSKYTCNCHVLNRNSFEENFIIDVDDEYKLTENWIL